MFKDIFKKTKYVTIQPAPIQRRSPSEDVSPQPLSKKELPDSLWAKCPKCGEVLFNKDLEKNARVCTKCEYHFRISARGRLAILADENSFEEWGSELTNARSTEISRI